MTGLPLKIGGGSAEHETFFRGVFCRFTGERFFEIWRIYACLFLFLRRRLATAEHPFPSAPELKQILT
jgi:hypothetical protein